jgi:uncharacterized membrane protein YheB (UPF0754 family)
MSRVVFLFFLTPHSFIHSNFSVTMAKQQHRQVEEKLSRLRYITLLLVPLSILSQCKAFPAGTTLRRRSSASVLVPPLNKRQFDDWTNRKEIVDLNSHIRAVAVPDDAVNKNPFFNNKLLPKRIQSRPISSSLKLPAAVLALAIAGKLLLFAIHGSAARIPKAIDKFYSRPGPYLLVPLIAAAVGWFTNWLAVQMIFYPITFRGIRIYQRPEAPLGLIGWQGIIPCKTRIMSERTADMVTSQMLSVKEAFARLEPRRVAELLAPELQNVTTEVLRDLSGLQWTSQLSEPLNKMTRPLFLRLNGEFVEQLTRGMQENIDSIFNLKACVVNQMLQDRTKLGKLFQKCGQKELDFLTNSGLWFGFLLGLLQMAVALIWDSPWSLSIGGGIVGLATNWLALKWIFRPVDPIKIGPLELQGKFLKRQPEVAKEFSNFFANQILTAEQLWESLLHDPTTQPAFRALCTQQLTQFANGYTTRFRLPPIESEKIQMASEQVVSKLSDHVPVLYSYMDETLGLEETLRIKTEQMTSREFERVLHPIFEENETTLILAGAALGFAAGLVQQGLTTGSFQLSSLFRPFLRLLV